MKNINIKYLFVLCGFVALSACDTEDELREDIIGDSPNPFEPVVVTADAGNVDFTNYVAVGASVTAGFADAALYNLGQMSSYPNQIAGQFAIAGDITFIQPDIDSERGYNFLLNSGDPFTIEAATFGRFELDATVPAPAPLLPGEPLTIYTGPTVNNFAVPGSRLVDQAVAGYGQLNPFYGRFAASETSDILSEVLATNPTFFTMFLGGNDVLGYTSSGGTTSMATNEPPMPPAFIGIDGSGNPIANPVAADPEATDYYSTNAPANISALTTDQLMDPSAMTGSAVFDATYQQVLGAMVQTGASGVVGNIPDVTTLPVFNLIPVSALQVPFDLSEVLSDELATAVGLPSGSTFADALNGIYFQYGFSQIDGTTGQPIPIFEASATNALVIETHDSDGARIFRQITENDQVPLSTTLLAQLTEGWGSLTGIVLDDTGNIDLTQTDFTALRPFPIPSQFILDEGEVTAIRTQIAANNAGIATAAESLGVPVVDLNTILLQAAIGGGIEEGGQLLTYDFSPNGIFSVDGLHPNPRGSAIFANAFIDVINATYGSTFPPIDVLAQPGVILVP